MSRFFKTLLIVVIVLAMSSCAVFAYADSSSKHVPVSSNSLYVYSEGITEEQAGILTEAASNEIKRQIYEKGLVDIEFLLDRYFRNMVRISYYDDSLNTARAITAPSKYEPPEVTVGTTKYTKSYDNSGMFTYRTKSGIYSAIFNATISMALGQLKPVGDILSWVYSVVSGAGPATQMQASAKTMYSYRYVEEKGWVYYLDGVYDYYPRVTVVSRDFCEHYWGQYVDVEGFAKQRTRDFGISYSEDAPHRGNSAWIKSKARSQWQANLPHYYEDWQ